MSESSTEIKAFGIKKTILVVDDIEINRSMLASILEDAYQVQKACDGQQAIDVLKNAGDDIVLVLLDLVMPNVSGYEVMNFMKEAGLLLKIPVIVISAEDDIKTERECLNLGASDFVRKPFDRATVKNRVKNLAELFSYKNQLEELVNVQTEGIDRQNKLLQKQSKKIKEINERITEVLGTIVEYRHYETGNHIKRVKHFTKLLAEEVSRECPEYSLTPEKIEIVSEASALHDIGKIAIKDSVLLKPGKLTPEEFEQIKTHTTKGYEILCNFIDIWDPSYTDICKKIALYHHERYDGKGYPSGLMGEDIPLEAQLVGLADVYDALTTKRVYKDAYEMQKAYNMILDGECGVFSPKLINAFKNCRTDFEQLAHEYKESSGGEVSE